MVFTWYISCLSISANKADVFFQYLDQILNQILIKSSQDFFALSKMVKLALEDKGYVLYQTYCCYWLKAFPWELGKSIRICPSFSRDDIFVRELCTWLTDKLHWSSLFTFCWWFSLGMPVMDPVSFGSCLGVSKTLCLACVTVLQSFKWIQKWMGVRIGSKWIEIKGIHKINLIWFYWFKDEMWINTLFTILSVLS